MRFISDQLDWEPDATVLPWPRKAGSSMWSSMWLSTITWLVAQRWSTHWLRKQLEWLECNYRDFWKGCFSLIVSSELWLKGITKSGLQFGFLSESLPRWNRFVWLLTDFGNEFVSSSPLQLRVIATHKSSLSTRLYIIIPAKAKSH